jgi:flavin-dependent dehydrogenase
VAGAILARRGARVRIVDRATFPRDKLCGDTVNPGTLARLEVLGLADDIEARGLRVDGMLVTGEGDVAIAGRYPDGRGGRAIVRRDLDWLLLQRAIAAGCAFEPGVAVRGAIVDNGRPQPFVRGAVAGTAAAGRELRAKITIAADGRRSTIAFGLGLARHPSRPRRWAIGGYFENFAPQTTINAEIAEHAEEALRVPRVLRRTSVFGEMHVRRGRYIGVAPVPGGVTNVCLVRPAGPADAELADPAAMLVRELARDRALRDRAAGARLAGPPAVLGPLAVDVRDAPIDGLLLAGDAAGFIDPMTGDGLRFATRGGELAAAAALQVLEHGWTGVHARLRAARRLDFGGKWRFNRVLRTLVSSPRGVDLAAAAARVAPAILRAVIARAGDCHVDASEWSGRH